MFWVSSDAWQVYLCFRPLHIASILWNYIQDSLGSLCLSHHNYTLIMGKVGCIVYLVALLLGCMGGSVLNVDITGSVKKKGRPQVLDWKWCLEGLFLFQVPVHYIYIVELYPIQPKITLLGTVVYQDWYITYRVRNFFWISCSFSLSLTRLKTCRKYLRGDMI